MSHLLDTNVLSEWRRPRPDTKVVRWLRGVYEDELYLSAATIAEIRYGVERLPRGRRRDELSDWLERDVVARFGERCLDVDKKIAEAWAAVMSRRDASGRPMSTMDAFIAATALVHGLTLVTRDTEDFATTGVPLIDPWSG